MSKVNDGGPAFPVPNLEHDEDFNGMALRDYFAAKALQGYVSVADDRTYSNRSLYNPHYADLSVEEWREAAILDDARLCYAYADAMLRVREEA